MDDDLTNISRIDRYNDAKDFILKILQKYDPIRPFEIINKLCEKHSIIIFKTKKIRNKFDKNLHKLKDGSIPQESNEVRVTKKSIEPEEPNQKKWKIAERSFHDWRDRVMKENGFISHCFQYAEGDKHDYVLIYKDTKKGLGKARERYYRECNPIYHQNEKMETYPSSSKNNILAPINYSKINSIINRWINCLPDKIEVNVHNEYYLNTIFEWERIQDDPFFFYLEYVLNNIDLMPNLPNPIKQQKEITNIDEYNLKRFVEDHHHFSSSIAEMFYRFSNKMFVDPRDSKNDQSDDDYLFILSELEGCIYNKKFAIKDFGDEYFNNLYHFESYLGQDSGNLVYYIRFQSYICLDPGLDERKWMECISHRSNMGNNVEVDKYAKFITKNIENNNLEQIWKKCDEGILEVCKKIDELDIVNEFINNQDKFKENFEKGFSNIRKALEILKEIDWPEVYKMKM